MALAASTVSTSVVIIIIISLASVFFMAFLWLAVVRHKKMFQGRQTNTNTNHTIELNMHRELPVPNGNDMVVGDYESIGDDYDVISESNMFPDAESNDNDSLRSVNDQISQNGSELDDEVSFISGSELDVGMYYEESEQSSIHSCPLVRKDYGGIYATGSICSIELQNVEPR